MANALVEPALSRGAALAEAIDGLPKPCALVDLEAFDRNLETLLKPLGALTLRVASKSLRVPALLERVLARPTAVGVLTFHARESARLAELGLDDFLVAYPPAPEDVGVLVELTRTHQVITTVDGTPAIDALARAARAASVTLKLCLDLDMSLRLPGAHLGVRRSPVRDVQTALALAEHIGRTDGVELTALLAYEAQIAGVQDQTGGWMDLPIRLIKRRSRPMVLERRAEIVHALRAIADIQVVNGGGTGSLHFTAADPSVTEVSAGSGLFCPHLFDGYSGLQLEPAAFFALSVVRSSDPGFFTCYGGGYAASGAAGPDRLPRPWWPEGLSSLDLEGFGEVQTPMRGVLPWGSTVLCRHAKSGELMEHFPNVHLVEGGKVRTVPTYRQELR